MRRREFIGSLVGAALPFAAHAQQAIPVVGYLNAQSAGDRPFLLDAFRRGLAEGGYVEGRNVAIEYRYADNRIEKIRAQAAELVSRQVAAIVATGGNNSALVAKTLTSVIPILFTSGVDPVTAGLVASLGRPEANVTGVAWFSSELPPKHIELLREVLPRASVFGLFLNPISPEAVTAEATARQAAGASGVRLVLVRARTVDEIDAAFDTLVREQVDAAVVGADPFYTGRAKQFALLAARHRIPFAYTNREFVEAGGLMAYGNNVTDAYHRVGLLTARILKGAKPADLPIERAVKFELAVSLTAAKVLGLTLPHSLLSRADEVLD
jgi:ABC-type uncharacterized transport system substrate-binding protein